MLETKLAAKTFCDILYKIKPIKCETSLYNVLLQLSMFSASFKGLS